MRNICIVRGEKKEKGEPARESIDKFNIWDYGDTPYLFGYYVTITAVTFCALYISEKELVLILTVEREDTRYL